MRTRIFIFLCMSAAIVVANNAHDLAASYVAFGVAVIGYLLHAIEFKLNKLLDEHGIDVPDYEIGKD